MLIEEYPRLALQGPITSNQLQNEVYVQTTPTYNLVRSQYPYVFEEITFVIVEVMSPCSLGLYGNAEALNIHYR